MERTGMFLWPAWLLAEKGRCVEVEKQLRKCLMQVCTRVVRRITPHLKGLPGPLSGIGLGFKVASKFIEDFCCLVEFGRLARKTHFTT